MTAQSNHSSELRSGPNPIGRLLRMRDVEFETSLDRSTIYRHIAAGTFPAPIRITANRVAWTESAINEWKLQQVIAHAA